MHELFYKEASLDNENTVRIFKNRSEVNKTDVLEGRLPENKGEIAADRLYLENNGLAIDDELAGLKITGAVALSDYSALFKNNTDMMLDANKFCVAVVTPETFDEIDENIHLCYAWLNNDKTLSDEQCRDKSDELGDILAADCGISDIVERNENQAISFTGEDMGGDNPALDDRAGVRYCRNAACLGLHKGRAYPPLHDDAHYRHAHSRRDRQRARLHGV